jgi:hypothetical protein
MFPTRLGVTILFLLLWCAAAVAIGVITGALTSLCLKLWPAAVRRDAVLGLLGFFAGYFGCVVASPHNAITTNAGPNPYVYAFAGAALLAFIQEAYGFVLSR